MAQLNSRGTQTRSRWDYYERSNGWAFVTGNVASGGIGTYFANNSLGALSLDIYSLIWAASITLDWDIWLYQPPLIITPLAPFESSVNSVQPDHAQPAGLVGMYTASGGVYRHIQRISNQVNGGILAPIAGTFFLTLPPAWTIAVSANAGTNPCELSMTVWYQEVLDNVAPAV